ncbi:MAG TPA: class I tRNA ligase family protein, partial [Myxococcales bacterium]|nr:class I tRNA ligase family protein [Myxococcales bacterium]
FYPHVPLFAGKLVLRPDGKKGDADPAVIAALKEAGALLAQGRLTHSYPHSWRSKAPLIFRNTPQWFISMETNDLRKKALEAIDATRFVPARGRNRIRSMIETRPDWCVSRQRAWGVPIPVFYCRKDREPLVSAEAMEHVASIFDKEGADAWFDRPVAELMPPGARCPKCSGAEFEKESDILDVWFDSGSSFAAVLGSGRWPDLGFPADLYLEGSDQHRGWFMSALMIGIGTRGQAPYKAVLTHGFLVDGEGRKMSKSLGNAPDPQGLLKKYGAELMRLWVAGSDYRDDIGFSNSIIETLSESYRKIRNTLRYCLSQLHDFDPERDSTGELQAIDRWALSRFERYRAAAIEAYERYEYHKVYRATVELCAVDLSAFYFDVLKDRTYCSGKRWPARRAAQTVLYRIVRDLCRLLAPILSFTAEEAWGYVPRREPDSVFLAGFPSPEPGMASDSLEEEFRHLQSLREVVNLALEQRRAAKEIGKATEAEVTLVVPPGMAREVAERYEKDLADLFLVASVQLKAGNAASAEVRKSAHRPCERCWRALPDVGGNGLCARCQRAVSEG